MLRTLRRLGLDKTAPVAVHGTPAGGGAPAPVLVSPRDLVAACLPDPAFLGDKMHGATFAGVWVTGTGLDGEPWGVYLYHVIDNQTTMRDYGSQCVVWPTAVNPVVAPELLATGVWSGTGVLGPEAFPSGAFLDLLAVAYGSPWGMEERTPSRS